MGSRTRASLNLLFSRVPVEACHRRPRTASVAISRLVREIPTQVWRRIGLLGKRRVLNIESYATCVYDSAQKLVKDGFFSADTARWYSENVRSVNLEPQPQERSAGTLR